MDELVNKYRGCMYGLAIGDALGYPVEFIDAAAMKQLHGPKGVTDFVAGSHPAGFVSDDTQMSLALARALFHAGDQDIDTIMDEVSREFVSWSVSARNDRAPGSTCMDACRRLARGVHWREAGRNDSKGCGTAMRAAPVGLRYHGDEGWITEVAVAQSLCTHGHDCATAGSLAVATAVDLALDAIPPEAWLGDLLKATARYGPEFTDKIEQAWELDGTDPEADLKAIGDGWVAEEAVAAALYCVLRSPEDYAATVLMAANTDGDSDSIACIAGAFSGALNGLWAIPLEWQTTVEDGEAHALMADSLHLRWSAEYGD